MQRSITKCPGHFPTNSLLYLQAIVSQWKPWEAAPAFPTLGSLFGILTSPLDIFFFLLVAPRAVEGFPMWWGGVSEPAFSGLLTFLSHAGDWFDWSVIPRWIYTKQKLSALWIHDAIKPKAWYYKNKWHNIFLSSFRVLLDLGTQQFNRWENFHQTSESTCIIHGYLVHGIAGGDCNQREMQYDKVQNSFTCHPAEPPLAIYGDCQPLTI